MPNVVRQHFNNKAFNKKRFTDAFLKMRATAVPVFGNVYDKYIQWHADGGFNAVAHGGLAFLAWHRAFLWEFEEDLQAADIAGGGDGKIGLPWWNWVADTSPDPTNARGTMWKSNFLGGNGSGPTQEVLDGPFVRAAWPPGPLLPGETFLRRGLGGSGLANLKQLTDMLALKKFDTFSFGVTASTDSFRNRLEGNDGIDTHNSAHAWIGGNMDNVFTSPIEPAFWLNHANVDRLWSRWQIAHMRRSDQWPADAELEPRQATASALVTAGSVSSILVSNGGNGYDAAPLVTISGGSGSGAAATAFLDTVGKVVTITVTNGGTGYVLPPLGPTVTINSPPPRATSMVKLSEPMVPWDGTLGTRVWRPSDVLTWQTMGPAGAHKFRYSTDPATNFRMT